MSDFSALADLSLEDPEEKRDTTISEQVGASSDTAAEDVDNAEGSDDEDDAECENDVTNGDKKKKKKKKGKKKKKSGAGGGANGLIGSLLPQSRLLTGP